MTSQIDLRELERRSFAVRFQDGLTDVYLGVVLLAVGLSQLLVDGVSERWLWLVGYALVCAVGFGITWAARRFVSTPRLGTVKLGPVGRRRQGRAMALMLGSLLFSAMLITLTGVWPAVTAGGKLFTSDGQVAALVAVWMLVIFGLASYVLDFGRGYAIGLLYALGLGLGVLLNSPAPMVAGGVLVTLLGVVVFARFVRQNPLPPQEGTDASS